MEERIVRFINALRGEGVRVSLAESEDAWRAIRQLGVTDREAFRTALRATLIKDAQDLGTFEELFSVYFGLGAPPLANPQSQMSAEERRMLQRALQSLASELAQLLRWLINGENPSQEELQALAEEAGIERARSPHQARAYARRMQQLLGWEYLQELLEMLWELLAQQGMSPDAIEQLKAQVGQNREALARQLEAFAGQTIHDHMARDTRRRRLTTNELMQRAFDALNQAEADALRQEVRRLAARLRSRIALRHRRGKQGRLDTKATLRANQRYGGVPFDVRFKQRRLKPKLVVLLDLSTSMIPVTEFFLWLLYEIQDQVQQTRSFAFIDHLEDVSWDLASHRPDEALHRIRRRLPPGHYNTDLGASLRQLEDQYRATIDRRTTVIVLGDGRNNYRDPSLEVFAGIRRRARRLIWLNPEHPAQWGSDDSDMLQYAPLCSETYSVRNLAQLAHAIDQMLSA